MTDRDYGWLGFDMTDKQKTDGERVVLRKAMGVTARMEEIVKRQFQLSWFKPSLEDQLRLGTLEHWEEKYKVGLEWILKQLVPFWRERYTKFRKGTGLGVAIATLTGKKSEELLQQRIEEERPEARDGWRAREQNRQVREVMGEESWREDWEEPRKMLNKYQRKMAMAREERRRVGKQLARRNYRNNPWREQ